MRNAYLEIQHYAVCMLCLAGKERARRSNFHDTSRFFQSRNKLKQCRATCISMQVFLIEIFFVFIGNLPPTPSWVTERPYLSRDYVSGAGSSHATPVSENFMITISHGFPSVGLKTA